MSNNICENGLRAAVRSIFATVEYEDKRVIFQAFEKNIIFMKQKLNHLKDVNKGKRNE